MRHFFFAKCGLLAAMGGIVFMSPGHAAEWTATAPVGEQITYHGYPVSVSGNRGPGNGHQH